MALSPNEKTLVLATQTGGLLFDAKDDKAIHPLRVLQVKYYDTDLERDENLIPKVLARSPDGKLIGGSKAKGRCVVWNAGSGKIASAHLKVFEAYAECSTWLWRIDDQGRTIFQLSELRASLRTCIPRSCFHHHSLLHRRKGETRSLCHLPAPFQALLRGFYASFPAHRHS
jgi:hypothetical protein